MAFGTPELNVTIHVLGLVESNLSYTDIYTGDKSDRSHVVL